MLKAISRGVSWPFRQTFGRISSHTWAVIIKVVTIAVALFLVFSFFRLNASSNQLAQQAKAIAEQNQRIAKANGRHIDCIAELFAQYTQNQKPISKVSLDKCQISEAEAKAIMNGVPFSAISGAVDFVPTSSNANKPQGSTAPSTNKAAETPPANSGSGGNTTPTPAEPGAVRQVLNGLHNVTEPIPILNKVL